MVKVPVMIKDDYLIYALFIHGGPGAKNSLDFLAQQLNENYHVVVLYQTKNTIEELIE